MSNNGFLYEENEGGKSEFLWGEDRVNSASREELTTHVMTLQQRLQRVETDVEDLRETIYFLLDLQVGAVDVDTLIEHETARQIRVPDQ